MDKSEVHKLLMMYVEEMEKPMNESEGQVYDEGYIDGIVDLLGDLITFLSLDGLNPFAEVMEDLQQKIYDRGVANKWQQ